MEHLSPAQLQTILNSQEGKKLLEILQKDSGTALQKAAAAAKSGDYAQVQALLKPVLEGTNAADLAQRLQRKLG